MIPARPRYARIEQLADSLLRDAGIAGPPVRIGDIVRSRGFVVRVMDLKDLSGLVVRDGGATIIGVNKAHALTRRRFTIAHELAHALLHDGQEVHYDKDFRVDFRSAASSLGVDVKEMEANFFAASILMPRRFLEADPMVGDLDLEEAAGAVKTLAVRYKVSPHAMSIRLGNLASRPTALPGVRRTV